MSAAAGTRWRVCRILTWAGRAYFLMGTLSSSRWRSVCSRAGPAGSVLITLHLIKMQMSKAERKRKKLSGKHAEL